MINIIIMLLLFTIISFVTSTTYTLSTNQFNQAYHNTLTDGDVVLLTSNTIRSGTYDSGNNMVTLNPAKGINVICEGSSFMSLLCDFNAGSNTHRVFNIEHVPAGQMIWLYGLLVQNGKTNSNYGGGGVWIGSSSSTLENIHFKNNEAWYVSIFICLIHIHFVKE